MRQRSGFTLVELSIVLVVIGLLIGGILAAQSMIETAKINAQVRQIEQFDILVSQFKERFHTYPGDSSYFSPIGNNNGVLEPDLSQIPEEFAGCCGFKGEIGYFWDSLSKAGMGNEKYDAPFTIGTYGTAIAGKTAPKAKIGSNGTLIFATTINSIANWIICNNGNADNGRWCAAALPLTPHEALSIDAKLDDGRPFTGKVQPVDLYATSGNYSASCVTIASPDPNSAYNTGVESNQCTLKIQMGELR